MMGWDDAGWGTSQWIMMSVTMLLISGGLIALGVWAVRALGAGNRPAPPSDSRSSQADEELAERFARGEIDAYEYNRRRAVLHPTSRGGLP
jgi:putative membrane protein